MSERAMSSGLCWNHLRGKLSALIAAAPLSAVPQPEDVRAARRPQVFECGANIRVFHSKMSNLWQSVPYSQSALLC